MRFSPGNAQHIGTRSEQQDSFGFSDPLNTSFISHGGVVAVVADGMGGLAHGSAASQTAVQTFLEAYQLKDPAEPISDALLRAINAANDAVTTLAREANSENGLGTTLAAAVMHEQSLYWVSAGDSRVYFYRDGQLTSLTADHIYAADLDDQVVKGEITQTLALNHPERASLTSYLGLEELPKVERNIRPFPIQPGDCALVCSDGLYRALSDQEIAATLQRDASKSCEALVQRALEKTNPGQDNITVLALQSRSDESPDHAIPGRRDIWVLVIAALVGIAGLGGYTLYFHGFRFSKSEKISSTSVRKNVQAPSILSQSTNAPQRAASENKQSPGTNSIPAISGLSEFSWNVKGASRVTVLSQGGNRIFDGPAGELRFQLDRITTYTLKPIFPKHPLSKIEDAELKITLTPPPNQLVNGVPMRRSGIQTPAQQK
ncbi:MAG: serine/threonine-protein phosphatase [Acidobacteriaceae bacterium]|nr:serine/threonine-protein phosphatase [Acidobacteriaceae bacterium]MBV9778544.1 serine/threonine-protein phosphatase [Acidobacteriaceae bacterium]